MSLKPVSKYSRLFTKGIVDLLHVETAPNIGVALFLEVIVMNCTYLSADFYLELTEAFYAKIHS